MVLRYLGLVLGFAFRRTTIAVDGLQILAASAFPLIAKLAGVKMAEIRAEKRLELAALIRQMHSQFLLSHVPPGSAEQYTELHEAIVRTNSQLSLSKRVRMTMAEINQIGRRRAVLRQQLSAEEFNNVGLYVIGVIDYLHTGLEPDVTHSDGDQALQ